MSKTELLNTTFYALGFLVLFASAELLYHRFKVAVEITRKYVHVFTGIICLSFPFVLETHWSVLILTCSFVLILVTSLKFNLLKSINAVDRKTSGSYLFPLVIYIVFWIYSIYGQNNLSGTALSHEKFDRFSLGGTIYYFLPILILSVSDPAAALFGKKWPKGKYKIFKDYKTLVGSSAFFISSFLLGLIFLLPNALNWHCGFLLSALIAFATTVVEAISHKGIDNLSIPVTAAVLLVLFNQYLIL